MNKNEINQRVKLLRKSLHLNHERFSKLIHIPTSYIYAYEAGQREVSDKVIIDICRKLSVNEQWLRTGKGEMLLKYNEYLIKDLVHEFDLDEQDKEFIQSYVYLSLEDRKELQNQLNLYMQAISKKM